METLRQMENSLVPSIPFQDILILAPRNFVLHGNARILLEMCINVYISITHKALQVKGQLLQASDNELDVTQ